MLIWGIDCREDRSTGEQIVRKAPLENARAFQSKVENAVSRLSTPNHSLVRNIVVLELDGMSGYVVTLIPKAEFARIRAIAPGLHRYYLRAGSSFAEVPHDALAGFFGRRPQPTLWPQFTAHFVSRQMESIPFATLGLGIYNNGPNLAERPYISIHPLSENAQKNLIVQVVAPARFDLSLAAIGNVQVVSKPDLVVAPGGMEDLCTVMLSLRDVASTVEFEVTLGAKNSGPTRFSLAAPIERLVNARDAGLASRPYSVGSLYDLEELISRFKPH